MSERKLIEAALSVIEAISESNKKCDALNRAAKKLFGDFYPHSTTVADCVLGPIVKLLDATLGNHEIASYFLYECCMDGGGAVHESDGTIWPLETVADLRKYVLREQPKPPASGEGNNG